LPKTSSPCTWQGEECMLTLPRPNEGTLCKEGYPNQKVIVPLQTYFDAKYEGMLEVVGGGSGLCDYLIRHYEDQGGPEVQLHHS
jgi:hypothetical protein